MAERKMSAAALDTLIKHYEGYRETAYKCPAGVWTLGYGSTRWLNGKPVRPGMTCTKQTAEQVLRRDVGQVERFVDARLARSISKADASGKTQTVPVPQWVFDASVSLAYNIGCGAWEKSTARRKINSGDFIKF